MHDTSLKESMDHVLPLKSMASSDGGSNANSRRSSATVAFCVSTGSQQNFHSHHHLGHHRHLSNNAPRTPAQMLSRQDGSWTSLSNKMKRPGSARTGEEDARAVGKRAAVRSRMPVRRFSSFNEEWASRNSRANSTSLQIPGVNNNNNDDVIDEESESSKEVRDEALTQTNKEEMKLEGECSVVEEDPRGSFASKGSPPIIQKGHNNGIGTTPRRHRFLSTESAQDKDEKPVGKHGSFQGILGLGLGTTPSGQLRGGNRRKLGASGTGGGWLTTTTAFSSSRAGPVKGTRKEDKKQ